MPRGVTRIIRAEGRSYQASSSQDRLSRYFDLLERTIEDNGLAGKPGQTFNMDESGMPLDPKAPKIVTHRGGSVVAMGSGNKAQVTIVGCVSAAACHQWLFGIVRPLPQS